MPHLIQKLRTPVRIALPSQEPADGYLSLQTLSPNRGGPETILDLLNSEQRVVPFIRARDEAVLMLTRQNLLWVEADGGLDPELVCPRNYHVTHEERVRVRLEDGTLIDGVIQMELPEELNRASDFLNGDGDFYPLITRDGTVLINKARVLDMQVFQESPLPVAID
jgi:hypothetical protein